MLISTTRYVIRGRSNRRYMCLDRETARSFGLLAAMMKAAGRSPRPRYNDLWIAAQAHAHHLPLLTSNPDDFRALEVIEVIEAPKTAH